MDERKPGSGKRKLRLLASLFLILLAVCTLAGNTIRNMSLQKVYTQTASKGSVTHEFEGNATVLPEQTQDLTNPAGWKVMKVLVKQGDKVAKGQKLIEYDGSEAMLQLEDMKTSLKKQQLSMNQLHTDYITAVTQGDESTLSAAMVALESAELDIASQENHIQRLQKNIADSQSISAPFAGIVTEVNALAGSGPGGGPDVTLANASKGFKIQLQVPGDISRLLEIGEALNQITLTGKDSGQLSGTIMTIDNNMNGTVDNTLDSGTSHSNDTHFIPSSVTVLLKDNKLIGGERVQVKIVKSNSEAILTLPNEAVHQDERGAYVFTVESKEGPLGNAYYAVKTPVKVTDTNAYVTAVTEGLFEEQEVIVSSTGYLIDGVRVRK
ncbi:efflux RND transporter periplasmic adaptor subunit [Paenibacillus sp. JDR-2]|uniref:efflux RND transporter periplasmic adaptor subunit n=1 Tax=Paenibacillus sp. (strain JDR-2) TaxID=324057 RepID=UPI00016659CC|nr:biotin/lipoyl-binding protein [Paenibacillus sp. JDR-2]ACT01779.1 efflux transporter, RND family, MFP subunit [Paenibacillus sp. JDR-2]